jgi:hypothetical protein
MPSYLQLHLEPDAALQAEWETISRLTAAAEARLRAAVLSRFTPAGRAVIQCGVVGYAVGQHLGSFSSATTGRDVLDGVYQDVVAVRSCSETIDEARAADRAAGNGPAIAVEDLSARSVETELRVEKSGLTLIAATLEDGLGAILKVIPK